MKELLGDDVYQALLDDIELLDVAGDPFDFDKVRAGELTAYVLRLCHDLTLE